MGYLPEFDNLIVYSLPNKINCCIYGSFVFEKMFYWSINVISFSTMSSRDEQMQRIKMKKADKKHKNKKRHLQFHCYLYQNWS